MNLEDLRKVFNMIGKNYTDAYLQNMINEVDPDGNGGCHFPAFVRMMNRPMENDMKRKGEDPYETFENFDRDGDGLVSKVDIIMNMAKVGENLTEEEVDRMFRDIGIEGDFMNFEQFKKAFF